MTKDRARKQAARGRKAATGEPYVLAKRRIGESPPGLGAEGGILDEDATGKAQGVQLALAEECRRRGWPVEVESWCLDGEWVFYSGPARVGVSTAFSLPLRNVADEEQPIQYHLTAPHTPKGGLPDEFDTEVPGPLEPGEVIDTLATSLTAARAAGLSALKVNGRCGICGDRYPRRHLLAPAANRATVVCPACIFDGDLVDPPELAYLTFQIDRLVDEDLTAPAGWSAVGALVAAFGGPGFSAELHGAWREAGSIFEPMPYWESPGEWWTWVAVPTGPLAALRPATSAARLATVFAEADPSGRRRVERKVRARTDQAMSDQLWTAAVAYVVAFDTQARDSPRRRAPWHVLESFDAVPDQWPVAGEDLARVAIKAVRDEFAAQMGLGWDDLGSDDNDFEFDLP